MTRRVRAIAPAKLNWSLEVLRIRPDGYHEVRSVMQTLALHDDVAVEDAAGDVTIDVRGPAAELIEGLAPEDNLAWRAAMAFRARLGGARGARIVIEKRIPVAAGLGGGSSDAAAVLRALNALWEAGEPEANLMELAAEVGSDPPFFIAGGTAMVSGRGEHVEPLADAVAPSIMLGVPPPGERNEKTASMYDALSPDDFSEGYVSIGVREAVEAGRMLTDELLANVFERVTSQVQPDTERAMDALRAQGYVPHLAGSGPSFFLLYAGGADTADELARRIRREAFEPVATHTLRRRAALRLERH
jgi:4-diphosphocytidyl-2-C-methyl-D-erythritol kinase